jgi:acetyl-CoA/propionyl-CoA carboxylase biotin carboxyl carrier protein
VTILAQIRSPLTGSISTFLVEDGAEVAEDETVIEIEAFKMFTAIRAPCAGIIRLKCTLGEVVGDDDLLAEIEGSR